MIFLCSITHCRNRWSHCNLELLIQVQRLLVLSPKDTNHYPSHHLSQKSKRPIWKEYNLSSDHLLNTCLPKTICCAVDTTVGDPSYLGYWFDRSSDYQWPEGNASWCSQKVAWYKLGGISTAPGGGMSEQLREKYKPKCPPCWVSQQEACGLKGPQRLNCSVTFHYVQQLRGIQAPAALISRWKDEKRIEGTLNIAVEIQCIENMTILLASPLSWALRGNGQMWGEEPKADWFWLRLAVPFDWWKAVAGF